VNNGDPPNPLDNALAGARARAEVRVRELTDSLAAIIEAAEASNLDDEHDPEGSTVGFERAQVAALLDQAQVRVAALAEAGDRLLRGTYGICDECGNSIPSARLEAQPATRFCVTCAATPGRPTR
jgi:RNA polymerase-binding transcription factor DksA